jgi:hypothetical protein
MSINDYTTSMAKRVGGYTKFIQLLDKRPSTDTARLLLFAQFCGAESYAELALNCTSEHLNRIDMLDSPHAATLVKAWVIRHGRPV